MPEKDQNNYSKRKDKSAVRLGNLRWTSKTKYQRSEHCKMMATKRWQEKKSTEEVKLTLDIPE